VIHPISQPARLQPDELEVPRTIWAFPVRNILPHSSVHVRAQAGSAGKEKPGMKELKLEYRLAVLSGLADLVEGKRKKMPSTAAMALRAVIRTARRKKVILILVLMTAAAGCGGPEVRRHKIGIFWETSSHQPPGEARPDVTT